MTDNFTPYSTLNTMRGEPPSWYPQEAGERVAAYFKYDEIYWNDPAQFVLRVVEGEEPIYIPNARTVVDTTAHYLLKGLKVTSEDPEKYKRTQAALKALLDREMFYPRFHTAKHSGVARGDWVFHMTADPTKPAGSRICMNYVDPAMVIPVSSEDDIDDIVKVHIVDQWIDPNDPLRVLIKKLTYEEVEVGGQKRIKSSEGLYEITRNWWGPAPKIFKVRIPEQLLPPEITTIPVYWFKNMDWMSQPFGSSELRGFEAIMRGVSQAASDQATTLALEGLGVYATDGGRPVDDDGNEEDWEIAPGKVMEVPGGSYFRRVEGVGSMKPSMDHINYLESKIREATALSDVALGRIDVQTAQSGIALAIKFLPTLAKIDQRDLAGLARLTQMFYDWKTWHLVYEDEVLEGDVKCEIGAKLPQDRTSSLNELNNMFDRGIISRQYYRQQMTAMGYTFPDDIEAQIKEEKTGDAEIAALTAPPGLQNNAAAAARGEIPPPPPQSAGGAQNTPRDSGPNRSNNAAKPNESAGVEATQGLARQARGGTPRTGAPR